MSSVELIVASCGKIGEERMEDGCVKFRDKG